MALLLKSAICFFALAGLCAAEVIDPGAGKTVRRGVVAGNDNVEVRSGTVVAELSGGFGGVLSASGGTLELSGLDAAPAKLKTAVRWTQGDASAPIPFTVRKNAECDWFTVVPSSGTLAPGEDAEFTVNLVAGVMTNRRWYAGTFFVTAANGLSRPVSVKAETDFVPPFHAEKPGETAIYAVVDPAVAASGKATYSFAVPKAGTYYFMVHAAASGKRTVSAAVDGEPLQNSVQQVRSYPTWTMITPGKAFGDYLRSYQLSAGVHTLTIAADYSQFPYDGVVLTDSPGSFEPR